MCMMTDDPERLSPTLGLLRSMPLCASGGGLSLSSDTGGQR